MKSAYHRIDGPAYVSHIEASTATPLRILKVAAGASYVVKIDHAVA
jgi:hypothetical protein